MARKKSDQTAAANAKAAKTKKKNPVMTIDEVKNQTVNLFDELPVDLALKYKTLRLNLLLKLSKLVKEEKKDGLNKCATS